MNHVLNKLIKIVPDTTIIISGLLWKGKPREFINLAESKEIELFGSEETYKEFCEVIKRPKFQRILAKNIYTPERLILDYQGLINIVSLRDTLSGISVVTCDKDDDAFFRTAKACNAKFIVTGDNSVLDIIKYDDIRIVKVATFLDIFPKLRDGQII